MAKATSTTEDKEKVFIFDDGSVESQLLAFECENNPAVKVEKIKTSLNPKKIEETYIGKLPKSVLNANNKVAKVHMHFSSEDFAKFDVGSQRNQINAYYPNLSIFYAYEHMTKDTIKTRLDAYNVGSDGTVNKQKEDASKSTGQEAKEEKA